MENEKRLIDANALFRAINRIKCPQGASMNDGIADACQAVMDSPTVDAVEVPCHCCDCYYLLNSKNSFGLYFFCGHQNGLKNLTNTEKNYCPYGKRRSDGKE